MSDQLIRHLGEDDFDETIREAGGPVLVDFWAAWCAPCRAVAPILDDLSSEYQGRATIAKVDVDAHGDLASRFGIRSIPTLVLFSRGRVVEHAVGSLPKDEIRRLIDKHLG